MLSTSHQPRSPHPGHSKRFWNVEKFLVVTSAGPRRLVRVRETDFVICARLNSAIVNSNSRAHELQRAWTGGQFEGIDFPSRLTVGGEEHASITTSMTKGNTMAMTGSGIITPFTD